jgi:hypothetical protein
MAGHRSGVAPTQTASSVLRRVQRFEEQVEAAGSPAELVAAASQSVRSAIKAANPDIACVIAAMYVDLCRTVFARLNSDNAATTTDEPAGDEP